MVADPRLLSICEDVIKGMNTDQVEKVLDVCLGTSPFDENLAEIYLKYTNEDTFVNRGNNEETNPLIRACYLGKCEAVKFLVKHGANVNCLSDNLTTPIMYAFQKGHMDIVTYLYDQGSKIVVGRQRMIHYSISSYTYGYIAFIEYLDEGLEKLRKEIKTYQETLVEKEKKYTH